MGDLDCGKWRKMEGRKKWIYPKARATRAPAEQGSKTETVEAKKVIYPLGARFARARVPQSQLTPEKQKKLEKLEQRT